MGSQINHVALPALSPEVLALLVASYGKNTDKVIEQATRPVVASKPSKLRAIREARDEATETHPVTPQSKPPMTVIALPPTGTHDARGFLLAMRSAKTRDEMIVAIAGYCGFDRAGDFGGQELAARMKAQREMRGAPKALPRPVNSAVPSVAGFVAGVPDMAARKVLDLLAREKLAAQAISEHEQVAGDESVDAPTRSYHSQLLVVETARLAQIRADLASYGAR